MRRLRSAAARGHARFPGLDSRHSFSFGDYHDPDNQQVSVLRVINDDRLQPGAGFPTHPHRDMEILTYVLDGVLEHRDSLGNHGLVRAGEMQMMSAGTGIRHSEFNGSSDQPLRLLQIWILPDAAGHSPRWQQVDTAIRARGNGLHRLAGPEGSDAPLRIHQDAGLQLVRLGAGETLELPAATDGRLRYLHLCRGGLELDGRALVDGDAVATDEGALLLTGRADGGEALLFDLPPGPVALTGPELQASAAA